MDFRLFFWLTVGLELAELILAWLQSAQAPATTLGRLIWTRFAVGIAFGSAMLLAGLSLGASTQGFGLTALSLAGMSVGVSQFAFALYYMRPRSLLPTRGRMRRGWKQVAVLSYAAFVVACFVFFSWPDFVVQ